MSTKKANLILTTCSMAWGTSYIFMKLGIEGLSPLMLMALRTGIAFLILVLILIKDFYSTVPSPAFCFLQTLRQSFTD